MKKIGRNSLIILNGMCLALCLSGCLFSGNSPTPRFYMLNSLYENPGSKKTNALSNVPIGIGPFKIPEYLDRPQMVTQGKEMMLNFSEFDRWAESLDLGMARIVTQNLTEMLPKAKFTLYPWDSSIRVHYQVTVDIIQMDSELEKDLFLVAQWLIIDTQNAKTIFAKRSEFRQPVIPHNYSGLAQTLSSVCTSLSSEISKALKNFKPAP